MNPGKLIRDIHRDNLSTYFILPLLKLNKHKFVDDDNFIDSYLTPDGRSLLVLVTDTEFFAHRLVLHPDYVTTWIAPNLFKYIEYRIPEKWAADVQLFIQGKYSRMSQAARDMIINWSDMKFRHKNPEDGTLITDVRLMALERNKTLRRLWETFYEVELPEDAELLSAPKPSAFLSTEKMTRL